MTIQSIIKKSIKRLEQEGNLLTPNNYSETFCKEMVRAGMQIEDCSQLNKFSKMLNKEFQKDILDYRIRTISEFLHFIVAKLNRTNPTLCTQTLNAQTMLIKKVLHSIELLHNKEARELARKTIDIIDLSATSEQLGQYKQLWVNFIDGYDDTFLQKLKPSDNLDDDNLANMVKNFSGKVEDTQKGSLNSELEKISSLLIHSFIPSISTQTNIDIENISNKMRVDPSLINNQSIEDEIKSAIALRITLDKKSVRTMVESLDGVLEKLSSRLVSMIESSDSSNVEVHNIKQELKNSYADSKGDFKIAHKKLYTIALALEKNTQVLTKDLKEHSKDIELMNMKIKKLEDELKLATQNAKEDFLTKIYNKRALDELFEVKEAEFQKYGHNFSIVMFDLDKFKLVNDNYGHDAGDIILASFAKILKKDARTIDIVGRFGGEEFIVLLNKTDAKGAVVFAEKVRQHIEKARFLYKGNRINLTVSCGIGERKKEENLKSLIKSADENMYKAKKTGRNKVVYE